jgi:hypothetical protein
MSSSAEIQNLRPESFRGSYNASGSMSVDDGVLSFEFCDSILILNAIAG